ncbi:hypothetical protein Drose_05815 [Dactylosporangium roseum]|uniref:Uncharacterized protein n=1 Tax=Dactylosporangium roseum TaxID=47989 RepID=A0ABY5Z7G7_9ACTN|nr:hypothetical protein [Dactylosporangium roseum]UWZ37787.1 hypothetical protein Drose_05815 [Dactylosporangium roseum]
MKTDTRFTLALEQLMLHPQFVEIAQHCQNLLPTAVADQHGAANRHTRNLATEIGAYLNGTRIGGTAEQVPGWLRLGVIEAWIAYCTGTADTCMHNPTVDRPQPVTAAPWRLNTIVCLACTYLLVPKKGSVADRTCDACGHECAGGGADDPIYPSVVQFGSLIYQFAVCTSCREDVLSTPGA